MNKFKSQLKTNANLLMAKQLQKQCGTYPIACMLRNNGVSLSRAITLLRRK